MTQRGLCDVEVIKMQYVCISAQSENLKFRTILLRTEHLGKPNGSTATVKNLGLT